MSIVKKLSAVSVAVLLFTAGCSNNKTAENRLQKQLQNLAAQYISGEIYKQLQLNTPHRAYRCASNNIFVVIDEGMDTFSQDPGHSDLSELAVARFYTAQSLEMQVDSVVPGEMIPIDHKKYTYRNSLRFKISEKRSVWQHVPGTAISLVWLKGFAEESAMQKVLRETAAQSLPEGKYDIQNISHRKTQSTFREYEVTVFVVYDPSLPGWAVEDVPTDIENILAEKITFFDFDSPGPQPVGTTGYKGRFYWNDSHLYRQSYDNGVIFFQNKWLKKSVVSDMQYLQKLTTDLNKAAIDLPKLTEYLTGLSRCRHLEEYAKACDQAANAGEALIKSYQDSNNRQALLDLAGILQKNQVFSPVADRLEKARQKAENVVNARLNKAVKSSINELKNIQQELTSLNPETVTAMQLSIIIERCKNKFSQTVQDDPAEFHNFLLRLHFAMLAEKEKWRDIKKLNNKQQNKGIWEQICSATRKDCDNCQRGKVVCQYCRKDPGKCSECKGISDYMTNRICQSCRSSGKCAFCNGLLYTKCLKCSGHSFLPIPGAAGKIIRECQININTILEKQISRLEATLL